jgi:ATP-dependent exoDNAse (exonuclease V) beta subunit
MNTDGIYDPDLSVALSASAGSGKTFALTTRLITMLLDGIGPSEILAITFTKLAANEIRRKMFDRLQAVVDRDENETAFFSDIFKEKPEEIIKRAGILKNRLIKQFSLLQISTIHSFFTKLIRCFPGETGYLTDIYVIDEMIKEKKVSESIELFYRKITDNKPQLDRVFRFISSYRERMISTGTIIKEIYNEVNPKYYILKDVVRGEVNYRNSEEAFDKSRKALFSSSMTAQINYLTSLLSEYIESHGKNKNIQSFIDNLDAFLENRKITQIIDLTPFKRDEAAPMVRYLKSVCDTLTTESTGRLKETLLVIRRSIINYLRAEMSYYLSTWMDIFRDVNSIYSEIKKRGQVIDFSDIELRAAEFLSGLKDFEYLGYRTGSQIRYVLIDEFQDTSRLEWDALENIVRNGLSRGGKLFYVGDVKQSIYRWRGGDPWLFEKVRAELSVTEKQLKYSYRQSPVLLNFVNNVFDKIQADPQSNFSYNKQSLPPGRANNDEGYVYIGQLGDRDELVDMTAGWIKLLQEGGVNLNDIAVLCRKNSEIEEIERCLINKRLPYVSVGKSKMYRDFSVMDIVNILNFALKPDEGVYIAGLLRSPVFRLSFKELDMCRDENGALSLRSVAGSQPHIHQILEGFLNRSHFLSPSGFIRAVYEELEVLNKYPDKTDVLLGLYEIAYTFENTYESVTLYDFAEYLQQNRDILSINTSEEKGVRLLTIHSSKGLEFHTVIVPFLTQPFKFRRGGSLMYSLDEKGHIKGAAIARTMYETYFSNSAAIMEIFEETERNYRVDELNILYVALTRAKENLIVLPLSGGRGKTIGDFLVSSHDPSFTKEEGFYNKETGRPVPSPEAQDESAKSYKKFRMQISSKKPSAYRKEEYDLFQDSPDTDKQSQRAGLLKGLVFHRAADMIKRLPLGSEEIDELLVNALSFEGSGFTRSERKRAVELARVSLMNTVTDKRLEKYFGNKSYNEINTLSRSYRNFVRRIDKLLIGNEIEILDFKTNRVGTEEDLVKLTGHYSSQIDTYCRSLMKLYPGLSVSGYLYFTDAEYDRRLVRVFHIENDKDSKSHQEPVGR